MTPTGPAGKADGEDAYCFEIHEGSLSVVHEWTLSANVETVCIDEVAPAITLHGNDTLLAELSIELQTSEDSPHFARSFEVTAGEVEGQKLQLDVDNRVVYSFWLSPADPVGNFNVFQRVDGIAEWMHLRVVRPGTVPPPAPALCLSIQEGALEQVHGIELASPPDVICIDEVTRELTLAGPGGDIAILTFQVTSGHESPDFFRIFEVTGGEVHGVPLELGIHDRVRYELSLPGDGSLGYFDIFEAIDGEAFESTLGVVRQ